MSCLPRKVRLLLFFQCRKHSHDRTAVYHCGNYLMLLPLQSLFQCLTASLQKCRSGFSAGKSQRSAAVDPCLIRRISGQFCIVLPFKVSKSHSCKPYTISLGVSGKGSPPSGHSAAWDWSEPLPAWEMSDEFPPFSAVPEKCLLHRAAHLSGSRYSAVPDCRQSCCAG